MKCRPVTMTHYSDPAREPHQAREVAESFGSDAHRYERTRPGYPDAMVGASSTPLPAATCSMSAAEPASPPASSAWPAAGCSVSNRTSGWPNVARQSGLEVGVTTFGNWDPAGRAFDMVIAAQAWHWIDPLAGAAKAAQALEQGEHFAAFWNAFQPPDQLGEAFADVYRRVQTGLPFNPWANSALAGYQTMCDKAADGLRQSGQFNEPERWQFDWDRPYGHDQWLDQVPTFGGHNQIPPAELQRLLAGVGEAIDTVGGSFTMGYATVVIIATSR